MAQRLAGEPNNSKFDTQRPEKEVTTTTNGNKTSLDTTSLNSSGTVINPATEDKQDTIISELENIQSNQISKDFEGLSDITVGTSEVEIVFVGVTKSIKIRAAESNTGIIKIGEMGVLMTGPYLEKLYAGDEAIYSYDDSEKPIYVISDTVGQIIEVSALL